MMIAGCFGGSQLRAGVIILFIVTSAVRADAEGAYAVGQNGEHWAEGSATDRPDAESARSAALTACQKDPSVGSSCKVMVNVSRQCLAVAQSSEDVRRWSLHIDPDIQVAKQEALQSCQKGIQAACTIRTAFCDKSGGSNESVTPVAAQIPHIFGYTYYDNVVGITIFGTIVSGDDATFKRTALSYLHSGNLIGHVSIFSNGGDVNAATAIGEQIRTLQAETEAPGLEGNLRTCPLDPQMSKFGNRTGGKLGTMRYNPDANVGDPRCRCESSCSLIWAAGVGRRGGLVGMHRFSFDASYYGNLSLEKAKETYGRTFNELQSYMTRMEVPSNIFASMLVTSSDDIRYLRKEEIAQLDNFPPYLAELKVAKCGTAPGNDAPDNKKETYITCAKGVNVALYGDGAKAYLKKYDSPSGISSPAPVTPSGTSQPVPVTPACLDVAQQTADRLQKIADAAHQNTTSRQVCVFGRASEIPTYRDLLAKANQNGCAPHIAMLSKFLDDAIRRNGDACRVAGQ
jgi:hypothetical protein